MKIYTIIYHSTENNETEQPQAFKTKKEARDEMNKWYRETTREFKDEDIDFESSKSSDWAYICDCEGFVETAEIFKIEIPE